jgi:hypothetical protein
MEIEQRTPISFDPIIYPHRTTSFSHMRVRVIIVIGLKHTRGLKRR